MNDRLLPLYKSTYGLVFFATPHRGGKNASTGALVASIAKGILGNESNSYLSALKKNSYFADILRDDFMERQEDFNVLTFHETLPVPYVGIVSKIRHDCEHFCMLMKSLGRRERIGRAGTSR
jgi:hypothetical protein